MSLYYYRGIRFVKNNIRYWLRSIFLAEQKEVLHFYDGTKKITFSDFPEIVGSSSWDSRRLPAILIDAANGKFIFRSVSKDLIDSPTTGSTDSNTAYDEYGGDIEINIALSILARTKREREDLIDIVGIYLAHPDAKDWFAKHYIVIPEGPSFGGETEIRAPNIDFPIYKSTLNWRVLGTWRERQKSGDSLIKVVADVNPYYELEIETRIEL